MGSRRSGWYPDEVARLVRMLGRSTEAVGDDEIVSEMRSTGLRISRREAMAMRMALRGADVPRPVMFGKYSRRKIEPIPDHEDIALRNYVHSGAHPMLVDIALRRLIDIEKNTQRI